ncbi:MAG TPA: hypothetical protein VFE06_19060 [Acidobacteriaceae bacterium]|jgi:hypothetical protein|nr:hypothetical protein [Acidobacteriaceae bacterium]
MTSRRRALLFALLLLAPLFLRAAAKTHTVALGAPRREPYSAQGDPAGAKPAETELKVRPLVVDGKLKEWTTGDVHDVTERSFAVRRAVRLNDALPVDKTPRWVWQRGPWLLVDRTSGKVSALHLPDFDPAVSEVVWFRDDAAYCGVNASGKQLLAVVAQVEARRPMLAKKLRAWDPADHPSPVCVPAVWQRDPLKVTFQLSGAAAAVSFDLVGASAVLVEDGDDSD